MLGLPRLLAARERLEAMTDRELQDLAQPVRRAQQEVSAALTARASLVLEGMQE